MVLPKNDVEKTSNKKWNFPSLNGRLEAVFFFVFPTKIPVEPKFLVRAGGHVKVRKLSFLRSKKAAVGMGFCSKKLLENEHVFFSSRFQTLESPKELFVLNIKSPVSKQREETERGI